MMIGNILDNTTELYMIKYTSGEIFSSGGATLYKNPSDQTVTYNILPERIILIEMYYHIFALFGDIKELFFFRNFFIISMTVG